MLDLAARTLTALDVPGARATAISASGEVFVATAATLHVAGQDGAPLIYRSATASLHGLAVSAGRVWFGEGTRLGALESRSVALGRPDTIAADAALTGSPTGAIWTRSEGILSRFEIPATGDEGVWQSTVRPIYAHTCSACHDRGGTAGIDLSTYDAWATRRSRIYERVVVRKDMPQGGTLPETDIAAIGAWAMPN